MKTSRIADIIESMPDTIERKRLAMSSKHGFNTDGMEERRRDDGVWYVK